MLGPSPFMQLSASGQFHTHLPQRPDTGSVTASIYSPGGSYLGTGSLTIDNATSSVNAAANVGVLSLNIGSTTNFRVGHRYIVGEADPANYTAEFITVKSKTNNTMALLRPLMFDHASGDPIGGAQVDITLTAAQNATLGQGYRVQIDYRVSASAQHMRPHYYDVVRYVPYSDMNTELLRDYDPSLTKKYPTGIAFEDLKNSTWEQICLRIRASHNPGSFVGTCCLTTAHCYLMRAVLAEGWGPDYREYMQDMRQRFEEEFKVGLAGATYDAEQDGATDGPLDKYRSFIRLVRR